MFNGFSENTIEYLYHLMGNNNRTWFQENKADYEKHLLNIFKDLVENLSPYMLELDPFLDLNFKKCISRINRDIRFSKDKTPYRTNMWISFKREYKDWKQEPTFYFELFPNGYRYGMGFYDIPKETLDKIRKMIDNDDEDFNKIHAIYKNQKVFTLEGNSYKRALNPDVSEELKEWYQKKEIYFVCNKGLKDNLFSKELANELVDGFRLLAPIYNFFLSLKTS